MGRPITRVVVRLAGVEVAKWGHNHGRKYANAFAPALAEGVHLLSLDLPVYVEMSPSGARGLPYIEKAEAAFSVEVAPQDFASQTISYALSVLAGLGVPIDGAEVMEIEIDRR